MVYRVMYSYRQRVRIITLFPNSFFLYMLREFAKVQVAHLHNAARAFSSPGKDFFLWNNGKKQIECGLAWHWWNFTDLGVIDMFLIDLSAEIVACIYYYYYYSENHTTS